MTEMTPATLTIFGVVCEGREVRSPFKGRDPKHVWRGVGSTCGWLVVRSTDRMVAMSTGGQKKWKVTREALVNRHPKDTGWGDTLADAISNLKS